MARKIGTVKGMGLKEDDFVYRKGKAIMAASRAEMARKAKAGKKAKAAKRAKRRR